MLFDKDTAAGMLARYQELRKFMVQKTGATARDLYEELVRQTARPRYAGSGGVMGPTS